MGLALAQFCKKYGVTVPWFQSRRSRELCYSFDWIFYERAGRYLQQMERCGDV